MICHCCCNQTSFGHETSGGQLLEVGMILGTSSDLQPCMHSVHMLTGLKIVILCQLLVNKELYRVENSYPLSATCQQRTVQG